jgi:hypothetical protein
MAWSPIHLTKAQMEERRREGALDIGASEAGDPPGDQRSPDVDDGRWIDSIGTHLHTL